MPMNYEVARTPVTRQVLSESQGQFHYRTNVVGIGSASVDVTRGDSSLVIGMVWVDGMWGKGLGTHVLHAAVLDAGPDQPVTTEIAHAESRAQLIRHGYHIEVEKGDIRVITVQEKIMKALPLVRLFEKGGIEATKVFVVSQHRRTLQGAPFAVFYEDAPFAVFYEGKTKVLAPAVPFEIKETGNK